MLKFAFYCISFAVFSHRAIWGMEAIELSHKGRKVYSDSGRGSIGDGSEAFLKDNNSCHFSLEQSEDANEYNHAFNNHAFAQVLQILKNKRKPISNEMLQALEAALAEAQSAKRN